jgi:hypothetical protein
MKFHRLSNCVDACVESAEVTRRTYSRDQFSLWHVLEGLAFALFCLATFWVLTSMASGQEAKETPTESVPGEQGGSHSVADLGQAAAPALADSAFQYYQELALPAPSTTRYFDFVLPVSVFDGARHDLGDLRLRDASGAEIPFALRIRKPGEERVPIEAREFNRTHAEDGTAELSLDLGDGGYEHNEVEIRTAGDNFRRRAAVEGSTDQTDWRVLKEMDLVKFSTGAGNVDDYRLTYPASRFRYLRVRVQPDPAVDEDKQVQITEFAVRRSVEIPGEFVISPATVSEREPVRTRGRIPGSAWIIDLGGRNVPCQTLLVSIANAEFNREFDIEPVPPEVTSEFVDWSSGYASGTWIRVAGEKVKPMEAEMGDAAASRLKLKVADHSNQPLQVTGVQFRAPARQIVFANSPGLRGPLRLYFGDPEALPPQYDFDRNLPAKLTPAPERLTLGPRQDNPAYIPTPKAITERYPWLIYVVLTTVSLVLAALIAGLARAAIAGHDAQPAAM